MKRLTRGCLIAALYIVLTVLLTPISYYSFQIRISEALALLPFFYPEAIWGLFLGCFIANIFGGLGFYDIVFGSLITLIAAILTYYLGKTKKLFLAPLPTIFLNAFGVSGYLYFLLEPPSIPLKIHPYFLFVISISIGETIATYFIGLPLMYFLRKRFKL